MNAAEFVAALKTAASEAAANGTLEVLRRPPGRRPDPSLVGVSEWFVGLSPEDQRGVAAAIDLTARQALYNVLLVLDGLLTLEPYGDKGELRLTFDDGSSQQLLNDPDGEELTVLFKELE